MTRDCKDCRYCEEKEDGEWCYKDPAVPRKIVQANAYCGEFEAKDND